MILIFKAPIMQVQNLFKKKKKVLSIRYLIKNLKTGGQTV